MSSRLICDEELIRRLPLPLARLYRQATNARSPWEHHQASYFLWEAGLKLLASTVIVSYADLGSHDAEIGQRLTNLARPTLGHWWEFVRLIVPTVADRGDAGFQRVRELILGGTRDDFPRTAGLDATLREVLGQGVGTRATVRINGLFDRLVQYRNRELGHGAAGQRPAEFYQRVGRALLAALPELYARLDVLAGRSLVYVTDVCKQPGGGWTVESHELRGETPRRRDPCEFPPTETTRLPDPDRVYLEAACSGADPPWLLTALHPLAVYDPEHAELLLLNSRRGQRRTAYLGYCPARDLERQDLGPEQRELLRRVLDMPVGNEQVVLWAARSQAEEGFGTQPLPSARPVVGEFELLSELGRGGMGVVYRAWQPSLERQVALKCLTHTGDKSEQRFAGEIRALGRVTHPHLVRIFTSGSAGDQWFYAMELLEGTTLECVCRSLQEGAARVGELSIETWHETLSTVYEQTRKAEKPLSGLSEQLEHIRELHAPMSNETPHVPSALRETYVRRAVVVIRQVAEAAHALHTAGIIHRDIKPGNIMLSPDGLHAVLMDLGLAQFADNLDRKLTRTRQFIGTLRYASPEQVLAVDRLDPRTDVYSLGATLWELLTLRPLFGVDEDLPTPELMKRIQYQDPEPVRTYHRGVPRDLEAIVTKSLEKDPGRRYASAQELADDLGRWLDGEPVQAQRPTTCYRVGKYLRRHRVILASVLSVVLLQVVILFGMRRFLSENGAALTDLQTSERTPNRHTHPASETPLVDKAYRPAKSKGLGTVSRRLSGMESHLYSLVQTNLAVLSSCGVNEYVRDWPEKETSLFGQFLAQGLAGEADLDADGVVDDHEIFEHVSATFQKIADPPWNVTQTPTYLTTPALAAAFPVTYTRTDVPHVGRMWAVLVGVRQYLHLSPIRTATADAHVIAKALVEHGCDTGRISVMTDDQPQDKLLPSRPNVVKRVQDLLDVVEKDDTVLLFFSCHGFQDDRGRSYLALQDANASALEESAMPVAHLIQMLDGCKTTQKLLILDCVHANPSAR